MKANDPGEMMLKATQEHRNVSDAQIRRAFESAVFSLSDVAFDRRHRRAVVAWRFFCGMLCGNGATVVLKRAGTAWGS